MYAQEQNENEQSAFDRLIYRLQNKDNLYENWTNAYKHSYLS